MKLKILALGTALTLAAGGAFAAMPGNSDGSGVFNNEWAQSRLNTYGYLEGVQGHWTSPDANPNYHGPGSTWDYHGAATGK